MPASLLQIVNALSPQCRRGGVEEYTAAVAHLLGGAVLSLTPHPEPEAEPQWRELRVMAPRPGESAGAAWRRALDAVDPAAVFVQHLGAAHPAILLDLRQRAIPYAVFLPDFGPVCPTLRLWHRRQERCSGPGRTGLKCAACVSGSWRRAAELPLRALLYRHRPREWRTALIRAELLVAGSGFARDYWIGQGAPPERIAVIPPVVEHSGGGPGAAGAGALARPGRRLLYAGGNSEAEGIELLGAALDFIRQPVELTAAGELTPRDQAAVRAAVAERHTVVFTGATAPAGLLAQMVACPAVVAPARWDMPYSPLVHAAQAMGARVVATAVGGLSEQIIHGVNGYLAAPDDPAALAEALEEALADALAPEAASAWGAELVAANARAEAIDASRKLRQLLEMLAGGAETEPALALEHGAWLEAQTGRAQEKAEALISALRLEGIEAEAADPAFARRAHAASHARRLELNHALAFFRGCGCRRIVHLGAGAPAPDAVAWFQRWGLERVEAGALPDGVFEQRGGTQALAAAEGLDPEWLQRRFPQIRAAVSLGPGGIETRSWIG